MPQNQTWQPSQGIVFSPSNSPPRQPYSTKSKGTTTAPSHVTTTKWTSSPTSGQFSKHGGRCAPSARPYQPPSFPKALDLELFASGAASEEGLVVQADEDLGEVLERACKENKNASIEMPEVAGGDLERATASVLSGPEIPSEPLFATPKESPTCAASSKGKVPKKSKGKVPAFSKFVFKKGKQAAPLRQCTVPRSWPINSVSG